MDASQQKHLKERVNKLAHDYMYGAKGAQPPPDPDNIKRLKNQRDIILAMIEKYKKPIDKRIDARRERVRKIITDARENVLFLPADKALVAVNALEAKLKKAVR